MDFVVFLRSFAKYPCGWALVAVLYCSVLSAQPPEGKKPPTPWGISSSASSFRTHAEWFPKLSAAGVSTVRLFPEWRGVETAPGVWNWDNSDKLVAAAREHNLEINAVLMGSPPGTKAIHAFPLEDLPGWSKFVGESVGRYRGQIRYWEVWNEGNAGFNDGKHTTADYATLAAATYDAAKAANPSAQVGLTVASFDPAYLYQTLREMAKQGKAGKFDYLCVHPYEIADGIENEGGEIAFLGMGKALRDVLRSAAPDKASAELWITEIGRRIDARRARPVNERDAGQSFTKLYTMAIAQGFACTQWFEAQDPVGEDQGFGLLDRAGNPRPAFAALQTLSKQLGPSPGYLGWLALGEGGRGFGFVFAGREKPVLVAWMPAGQTERSLTFAREVEVIDPLAASRTLPAGQKLELTDAPLLILGLPAELVEAARANSASRFPWGGDFAAAEVVSCEPGKADGAHGLYTVGRNRYPVVTYPDGSSGILVPGDIGKPVGLFTHPSFASVLPRDYFVRVTIRRIGAGNVGMNLKYATADSQGRNPYANVGQWFSATPDAGWQTHTWKATGASLSKIWGFDLSVAPEQSVPFVLGKVEISTTPFPKE